MIGLVLSFHIEDDPHTLFWLLMLISRCFEIKDLNHLVQLVILLENVQLSSSSTLAKGLICLK